MGISGSLRRESHNTKLVHECARVFGECSLEMADLNLPLFNADLEGDGVPGSVIALIDGIANADALIVSTPEYNGNIPGVLKNALDWISRSKPTPLEGKPLAIVSAAAGRSGGARAQYDLRLCLVAFRPRIAAGPEVMIAGASSAFGSDGTLVDEASVTFLGKLMDALKSEIARG